MADAGSVVVEGIHHAIKGDPKVLLGIVGILGNLSADPENKLFAVFWQFGEFREEARHGLWRFQASPSVPDIFGTATETSAVRSIICFKPIHWALPRSHAAVQSQTQSVGSRIRRLRDRLMGRNPSSSFAR